MIVEPIVCWKVKKGALTLWVPFGTLRRSKYHFKVDSNGLGIFSLSLYLGLKNIFTACNEAIVFLIVMKDKNEEFSVKTCRIQINPNYLGL